MEKLTTYQQPQLQLPIIKYLLYARYYAKLFKAALLIYN